MAKTPDFESGNCRFESCHDQKTNFWKSNVRNLCLIFNKYDTNTIFTEIKNFIFQYSYFAQFKNMQSFVFLILIYFPAIAAPAIIPTPLLINAFPTF